MSLVLSIAFVAVGLAALLVNALCRMAAAQDRAARAAEENLYRHLGVTMTPPR